MRVLAGVWTEAGADVLGLAPSAAAAAALRDATGMPCETLAKLVHDLDTQPDSPLAAAIGPGTLLVVDEAGMADTITLDRVIGFAIERGATVRLIGDDQQLAAIGAGGVLRDIARTHGAVRLDEVVRFDDPVEAEASLALRDGDRARPRATTSTTSASTPATKQPSSTRSSTHGSASRPRAATA